MIAEKFKFEPTATTLKDFCVTYAIPKIGRRKLAELMIIDDWAGILGSILPALKKGVYSSIDWAHNKYVKPALDEVNEEDDYEQAVKQLELEKLKAQNDLKKRKI